MTLPLTDTVTVAQTQRLIAEDPLVRVIDVRTGGEFEHTHIPGSFNIPLDTLHEHSHDLADLEHPIVLVCQSGNRASAAQGALRTAGKDRLHLLDGGIAAWERAGADVVRGESTTWAMDRQVRLVAGSIALAGLLASVAAPQSEVDRRRHCRRARVLRGEQHLHDGHDARQAALQPDRPLRHRCRAQRDARRRDPERGMTMKFTQYYLDCLSQASYLIGDETSGRAVVVDPRRDIDEYVRDAEAAGLTIELVLETHFHADFLSGHLELAAATGADIGFSSVATTEFPSRPLADGERIELGDVVLEIRHTPGHTPESISIVVWEHRDDIAAGRAPYGVLTGDTLFIGDVGRARPVGLGRAHPRRARRPAVRQPARSADDVA